MRYMWDVGGSGPEMRSMEQGKEALVCEKGVSQIYTSGREVSV
jgi:hypothetical protein